ncbi:MAG: RND transporter [Elusimicrobiota bacterium]
MAWLDRLPWSVLVLAALALGLAPFYPKPHIVEKLQMLFTGKLSRPLDIFDLLLHGLPWALLLAKALRRVLQDAP